jgi:hypothetical protein
VSKLLRLGGYISRDNDVRVAYVGKRMGEVIDGLAKSGELEKSFDIIVHSTGGLVARKWLTSRHKGSADKCPMKRLAMLAPANYGSILAATGKSFLGWIVKGYDNEFQRRKTMPNDLGLACLAGRRPIPTGSSPARRIQISMTIAGSNRPFSVVTRSGVSGERGSRQFEVR